MRDGAAVLKLLRGSGDETTSAEALRRAGVSRTTVESFFAPFLRGIFLEERLTTSSRFLDFVLRAFADGPAGLPAGGMGAIAAAARGGTQRPQRHRRGDRRAACNLTRVGRPAPRPRRRRRDLRPRRRAAHGWNARHVRVLRRTVDADSRPVARRQRRRRARSTTSACRARLSPSYAPPGRALVSATILGAGDPDLEAVERQLRGWFGSTWRNGGTCGRTGSRERCPPTRSARSASSPCASPRASMRAATTASTRR